MEPASVPVQGAADYDGFFSSLAGASEPYEYQRRVWKHLVADTC